MNEEKYDEYAEVIREMVRHENHLLNHRFTWFVSITGFLLVAIGYSMRDESRIPEMWLIIPVLGIIIALASFVASIITGLAIKKLFSYMDKLEKHHNPPPVYGLRVKGFVLLFMPDRIMPIILLLMWTFILLWAVFANELKSFPLIQKTFAR